MSGCPAQCVIGSEEWDGSLPLTSDGSTRQVSGTSSLSFTCDDKPNPPTYFTVSFTVTSAQVVDGAWTATALSGTYKKFKPVSECTANEVTWAMTGTRS